MRKQGKRLPKEFWKQFDLFHCALEDLRLHGLMFQGIEG